MMKLTFLLLSFFLMGGEAIAQKQQMMFPPPILGINEPDFIDFCQVPNHKGERVYTRFIYSGVDEYWSLHAPDNRCSTIKAEFDIPDSVEVRSEFLKLFKEVHSEYSSTYLIIDAIGFYRDDKKTGYGHLGSNNANFEIQWLVNVQKVNRKR